MTKTEQIRTLQKALGCLDSRNSQGEHNAISYILDVIGVLERENKKAKKKSLKDSNTTISFT
jgi:bifunctional N-acetylglucosamine-1-phosphate-uridyltransferase/glucosamine-1-phosphate-acetyltransferase GlmU-like protein